MTKELVGENEKGKIQGCLTRVLISVWTQSKDTTNRRPVQVLQYHWSSNHHAVLTLKSSFFIFLPSFSLSCCTTDEGTAEKC